ncbi:MAG: hypothetical protein IH588_17960 [Anaerolineales bacterium]|nr:hypothetical protein [Anaerolineales bacterium]
MTQSFTCSACGAPNYAEADSIRMACAYCGANLTIPEHLRTKSIPNVRETSSKTGPAISPEIDAPDLFRKAQPIAVKAWNLYAYWTWVRWLLPACLTLIIVSLIICAALGALPLMYNLFR